MGKRILIVVIALAILFGLVFGFHAFRTILIGKYIHQLLQEPVTISTTEAKLQSWHPELNTIGNLTAVNGVDVSSQVPGQVVKILFQSGQDVKEGAQLIQLDDAVDLQNLKTQQAQFSFAQSDYNRKKTLAERKVIAESDLEQSYKTYTQAQAALSSAQLSVEYKKIKAPFSGRLGISQVNIGQFISPGMPLVTLQQMDPLFVDFSLPEQELNQLYKEQPVEVSVGEFPGQKFPGKISAVNSKSDPVTHTIGVRATVPNPQTRLYPGLFATVDVILPSQQSVVTLPQTCITYSLHGDSVYVVVNKGKDKNGNPNLVVEQRFVKLGESQGGRVAVLSGVQAGEQVVNSGQLKLQPRAPVRVNNSVQLKE
jgi:membrane fusion protein (multidrug efflux system)